jgi:2-keto-4-pentenoate hydratase
MTAVPGPRRDAGRPVDIGDRGRDIYGPTPPSGAAPCARTTPLTGAEIAAVVDIIVQGHIQRSAVELPESLRTRDWASVEKVVLQLDTRLARLGAGWKVGGASEDVRRAEGVPSPSPGRIYHDTIFSTGASLGPELFINYRNIECEFAFELDLDFPVREKLFTEADVRAGIHSLFPALELGDCVFLDWYGASGYFGSSLDNGGSAGLVTGTKVTDWRDVDLVDAGMDLYMNGWYLKSGKGRAAMGHPVTSLTWMINWARAHGIAVAAGEVVSTGTCTGHCFARPGDVASADYGALGRVEVSFY